jgi:23S rRNA pseudouridine2604 synthase
VSFRLRIKYFLIHRLNYTNKTAGALISSGKLTVNGKEIRENEILKDEDELKLGDEILKPKPVYRYFALNKPRGIETTFNQKIKDNLSTVFPFAGEFSVAGRLDKASEGLLIISDDGKWINSLIKHDNGKEKEYIVEVDKLIIGDFISKMSSGIDIGFYVTQTCFVKQNEERGFTIILKEGKNKQIRRMCKKLGYQVQALKRVRIDKYQLIDLENFRYKEIDI